MSDPVWSPSAERISNANLTRFIDCVNARRGLKLSGHQAVYDWSIADPANFWCEVARFTGVIAQWGSAPAIGPATGPAAAMPGARWFADTTLNFAENLLRHRDSATAIVFRNERGARRHLSHADLLAEVARVANGLRQCGVGSGDRVAGFLPNLPEAVIAMLATTSLGAIWSSCSPDFGHQGVLDRFSQIAPKVLFTADGYFYAGKTLDSLGPVAGVLASLDSVVRTVVVPYVAARPRLDTLRDAVAFGDFGVPARAPDFARTSFDHPVYILYSSGTTGAPKCIVHGAGGTLLQHQKEHVLHTDVRREDRLFYFTTCGWMMWNWLASGLATGATLILYDGSPFHPDPGILWRIAEEERISIFGTSAKYLASVEKSSYRTAGAVDLSSIRTILSTGSPLAPESYDFVYRDIKADVQLASISGGTDIVSCFALGSPLLPVYRGEIQCRGLGMRAEIFDDAGAPLRGERGELVCTAPFPSMPLGFWNDPDGRRYHAAYFERFPGVWHHGDYAVLTEHDGIVILGRSDAVLNPGGVRIGTAEIYRQVEKLPEILESLAIGQDWHGDVRVVLFVRLRDGVAFDAALRERIRETIRRETTPRHVPARILAVADIPRTLNGKISELAVREVVHGRAVRNAEALANPAALELFRGLPELAT